MCYKILILEDDNNRVKFFINMLQNHDLKVIESAYEAIQYLVECSFDYIFLDNDLGMGNGEGIDVARFIYDNHGNSNNSATIVIHSWNSPAAGTMKRLLPHAIIAPFRTDKFLSIRLNM